MSNTSKLTFEEIKAIIESRLFEDNDNGPEQYMHQDMHDCNTIVSYYEDYPQEFIEKIKELGPIKLVHRYGGEGRGDEYWKVYHFINHDVYIKFDGFYQSYEGAEYKEMFEVKPVEVTKTEYQRVKND